MLVGRGKYGMKYLPKCCNWYITKHQLIILSIATDMICHF